MLCCYQLVVDTIVCCSKIRFLDLGAVLWDEEHFFEFLNKSTTLAMNVQCVHRVKV